MIYRSVLRPILFRLPPETVHELALHSLTGSFGLANSQEICGPAYHALAFRQARAFFGLTFANPVGLAGGF